MIEIKKILKSHFLHKFLFIMLLLYLTITIVGIIAEKDPNYIITLFAAVFYLYFSVMRFPEMALAGLIVVNYAPMLRPFTGFGMTKVFVGAVLLSSACYIFKLIIVRSIQIKMDALQLCNLLFSFWLMTNLLAHTGFVEGYGLYKLQHFFVWSLVPFYAVVIFKNDLIRIERFVYFYVFGLVFSSAIGLVFWGYSPEVQRELIIFGRFSIFTDPINYAIPFTSGVLMTAYLYSRTNSKYFRIVMLICMGCFSYMILLSGTRQSSSATILGMTIFFYLMRKRTSLLIPLVALAVVSWVFFSYVQKEVLLSRYLTLWQSPVQAIQSQMQPRFSDYQDAFTVFLQSPLTGVGLGEYGRWLGHGDLSAHAHNLFLEILAEEGLIGILLFTGFLWYPVKKGMRIMLNFRSSDSRFPLICLFFSIISAELFRSCFSGGVGDRTILWFSVGALWVIASSYSEARNAQNKKR